METWGKSPRNGVEASVPVNSIRSNTVVRGTHRPARPFPRRWHRACRQRPAKIDDCRALRRVQNPAYGFLTHISPTAEPPGICVYSVQNRHAQIQIQCEAEPEDIGRQQGACPRRQGTVLCLRSMVPSEDREPSPVFLGYTCIIPTIQFIPIIHSIPSILSLLTSMSGDRPEGEQERKE